MKKRTEKEIMAEFAALCCALSPENLHCDGEITPSQAQMKYIKLMTKWRKLETEIGRKVSESEVYQYEMATERK
jgi:hypothetical protein